MKVCRLTLLALEHTVEERGDFPLLLVLNGANSIAAAKVEELLPGVGAALNLPFSCGGKTFDLWSGPLFALQEIIRNFPLLQDKEQSVR